MDLKKEKLKKTFNHTLLVYLLVIGLGLVITLVFCYLTKNDVIYLYDDNISVNLNSTYKINVITNYKDSDLSWSVENNKIATIDKHGKISTHKLGETNIIVKSKYGLFKKIIKLRVSQFNVYSIVFDEDNIKLDINEEKMLLPILNNDSNVRSNLSFKSSDDEIVKVASNGKIKGLKEGFATITVTDKYTNLATSININVNVDSAITVFKEEAIDPLELEQEMIENITLNTNHLDMYVGSTRKISATIYPTNIKKEKIQYESSDNSIATVSQTGIVKAHKKGVCNIFVTSEDRSVSASAIVKVAGSEIKINNLSFKEKNLTLDIGENYVLTPIITPSNASNKKLTYTSSNKEVATVSEDGQIKAQKAGTTTIVVISQNERQTASVNVKVTDKMISDSNLDKLELTNFKNSMVVGQTNKINVKALNKENNQIKVNLTTSSRDVISVDQTGNIIANAPGIASIQVSTIDGKYVEKKIITVLPEKIGAELVYVNKNSLQLVKGAEDTLIATVIPFNAEDKTLIWKSSNPKIVSVSDGKVKGVGIGTAQITVQVAKTGVSRTIKVAVVDLEKLIDVRRQSLKPYYQNLVVYDEGTKVKRAMQNFAIARIGQKNETVYLSFPSQSTVPKKTKLTKDLKNSLTRTVIARIPKTEIKSPSSSKRTYMYLNNSGHGQALDLDYNTNYLWSNGGGYTFKDSKGTTWGSNHYLVRTKIIKNKSTSKYKATNKIVIKNNGVSYSNCEVAFDWDQNLAAVRSGRNVFIYKATDFRKGKLTLLYNFVLSNKLIDGNNYPRQGHDLANGYYYQYRGYIGSKLYIEAYNYVGQLQYTYIFNPNFSGKEAEGLKIYQNKIYIGFSANCPNCAGKVNNIYYFK